MTNNKEMTKANNTRTYNRKKVLCVETGVIYASGLEASKAIGCNHSYISKVCHGKRPTCKGLHFRYVDKTSTTEIVTTDTETEKEIIVSRSAIVKGKGKRTNGNTNAVLCLTTGDIYTSCTDAAEQNGVLVGHMSLACRHKRTAKGKKYCYVKNISLYLDEISDAISKKNLYTELLAKENRRKQLKNMIADYDGDIARLENELSILRSKRESARKELEDLI